MMTRNWLRLVGGAGAKKLRRNAAKDEMAGESKAAGLDLMVSWINAGFSLAYDPCKTTENSVIISHHTRFGGRGSSIAAEAVRAKAASCIEDL